MKPASYKRLFAKYKIAPVQMSYVTSAGRIPAKCGVDCAACAVGIKIIQYYGSPDAARQEMNEIGIHKVLHNMATKMGLSDDFYAGLSDGWESFNCDEDLRSHRLIGNEQYEIGYQEGFAAASACKPKSLLDFIDAKLSS